MLKSYFSGSNKGIFTKKKTLFIIFIFSQKSFEKMLKFYLLFRLIKGNIHQKENTIHALFFFWFHKNPLKTSSKLYLLFGLKKGNIHFKKKHYS
jgi:hypothetical protein